MNPPDLTVAFYSGLALLLGVLVYIYLRHKYLISKIEPLSLKCSQFEIVDDFNLHYLEQGSGTHLLLLHGIGASTYCWRLIFEDLSKKFHTIVLDLPGFGLSSKIPNKEYGLDQQAKRIIKFLDQKSIHQVHLVGSSMGGTLALWLNFLDPDRFKKIVAIAPATNSKLVPVKFKKWLWSSSPLQYGLNHATMKLLLQRVLARHSLITSDIVHNYLVPYKADSNAVKILFKATELLQDSRLPKALAGAKGPSLLLWGKADKVVPEKYILELKDILPQAKYLEHPTAGHHIMEDEPQWILENIFTFLSRPKGLGNN